MRLVDEDGAVGAQVGVGAGLGEQDAVGHHLEPGRGACAVGEAHLEADQVRVLELLPEPGGDAARGDAARLGAADQSGPAGAAVVGGATFAALPSRVSGASSSPLTRRLGLQCHLQRHLGQLCGLAGAGLAADDHHLVPAQGGNDLIAAL